MPVQQPIITDAGKAALINANNNGFDLELTHIGFGTSNFTPTGAETQAVSEVKRVGISGSVDISPTSFQIMANVLAGEGEATWIASLYFYAGDVLFAVYSEADGNIFYLSDRHTSTINYMLDVSSLPEGSITIKIDAEAAASLKIIGEQTVIIRDMIMAEMRVMVKSIIDSYIYALSFCQIGGRDLAIDAQSSRIGPREFSQIGGRNLAEDVQCLIIGSKHLCQVGGRDSTQQFDCENIFQPI